MASNVVVFQLLFKPRGEAEAVPLQCPYCYHSNFFVIKNPISSKKHTCRNCYMDVKDYNLMINNKLPENDKHSNSS
jgi:hypothetical protein